MEQEEKRRYWLKLDKAFLSSNQIRVLQNQPQGKDYVLFYLGLLLESVETVGHLRFSHRLAYNSELLAAVTGTEPAIAQKGLAILADLGMVEILQDGTLFLPCVPGMTGKEGESAERVRRFREKKRQLLQSNSGETNSNANTKQQEQRRETEKKDRQAQAALRFAIFWKEYPKKRNKDDAERAFGAARVSGELLERMLRALALQKQSADWRKEGGKYIPYPSRWLRARGWEDETEVEKNGNNDDANRNEL